MVNMSLRFLIGSEPVALPSLLNIFSIAQSNHQNANKRLGVYKINMATSTGTIINKCGYSAHPSRWFACWIPYFSWWNWKVKECWTNYIMVQCSEENAGHVWPLIDYTLSRPMPDHPNYKTADDERARRDLIDTILPCSNQSFSGRFSYKLQWKTLSLSFKNSLKEPTWTRHQSLFIRPRSCCSRSPNLFLKLEDKVFHFRKIVH